MNTETKVVPISEGITLGIGKQATPGDDRHGGLTTEAGTWSKWSKDLWKHARELGLDGNDLVIIEKIVSHEPGRPVPQSWIWEDTPLSRRTVERRIAKLIERNLVTVSWKAITTRSGRVVEGYAYNFEPLWVHVRARKAEVDAPSE